MSLENCILLANKVRTDLGICDDKPLTQEALNQYLFNKEIKVKFYSALLEIDSYDSIIDVFGKDGAALLCNGEKIIMLNDIKDSSQHRSDRRWIWTLLHECGHFECGHLIDKDCMRLRNSVYDSFEKEADCFTANILMPQKAIISAVNQRVEHGSYIDSCDLAAIADYFSVSWSALINRLDYLGIQDSFTSHQLIKTYSERKVLKCLGNDAIYYAY